MQKKIRGKGKKGHTGARTNSHRERQSTRVRERGRENTSTGMMGKEVATY